MEEIVIEQTTLWDLLSEPSLSLHLPRFALFLVFAITLEIIYTKKKVCVMCSMPTVILQLHTGIFGITGIYYMMTSSFHVGERVAIPAWYYPAIGTFILGMAFIFLRGAKILLVNRLISSLTVRCVIFGITIYFAITAAITPSRINKSIGKWEINKQNQVK